MKVLKITARIERGGTADIVATCDMVVIDGAPHVVFELEGDHPSVTAALDPRYLQTDAGIPGIDAVYQQPVKDPRRFS